MVLELENLLKNNKYNNSTKKNKMNKNNVNNELKGE
jgi:hypothetical protein